MTRLMYMTLASLLQVGSSDTALASAKRYSNERVRGICLGDNYSTSRIAVVGLVDKVFWDWAERLVASRLS